MLQTIEWVHQIEETFRLRHHMSQEIEQLKAENFRLKMTALKLREVLIENSRLRRLLKLKEEGAYRVVAARVIGSGTEGGIRSLIISVGEQDSVRKNMPVVNADGLVGRVIATTPGQSIVQILMDHNSLVSARLQHSREAGVIAWSGNSWLDLLYIPKNIPVEKGEMVITSELSRIYPPGLKIGIVTTIKENKFDLFKEIRVKPAVNFNAVEEVFVIRNQAAGKRSGE